MITRVNSRLSNIRRSTFNIQPPSLTSMLTIVIVVLLKQISIVTTEHERRPVTVCDLSSILALLPTL